MLMQKRMILFIIALILSNSMVSAFNYVTCHNSSDCTKYPMPSITQPAKGSNFTDPYFNSVITRISDSQADAGKGEFYLQYSRYTPVSSDGKYLITAQDTLYNLTDLSYMGKAPHLSSDPWGTANCGADMEYRWDYTGQHPTRLYYRYGTKFYQADIITKQNELIRDFKNDFPETPSFCAIQNDDEGDSSADSRYWVFEAIDNWNSTLDRKVVSYIFVYDKDYDLYNADDDGKPGKIISILNRSVMQSWGGISFSGLLPNEIFRPNFVDISPSGRKVMCSWSWHQGGANSPLDGCRAYNLDFTNPVKLAPTSTHSGWGYDSQGNEVYVYQDSSTDWITMVDVNTGQSTRIIYHTYFGNGSWDLGGWHLNRFYNSSKKGWILMSFYDDDNNEWADNELIMLELKSSTQNPRVWRIAKLQNVYQSTRAATNLEGNKVYWGANWNGNDNMEIYMANLPEDWQQDLSGPQSYHPADTNQNNKIEMKELIAFIGLWKQGNANVNDVLSALDRWMRGA